MREHRPHRPEVPTQPALPGASEGTGPERSRTDWCVRVEAPSGRLSPRNDDEKQRGLDAGLKFGDNVYEADDLVKGNNTIFVATGVTDGQLVAGVRREGDFIYTESVVLRGRSGTLRRIASEHLTSKWL